MKLSYKIIFYFKSYSYRILNCEKSVFTLSGSFQNDLLKSPYLNSFVKTTLHNIALQIGQSFNVTIKGELLVLKVQYNVNL
jgi:hypothetical protein